MDDLYKWYKKGFESLTPKKPSPHVWDAISAGLDSSSKKKKRIGIRWISGVVLILISMCGFLLTQFDSNSPIIQNRMGLFDKVHSAKPISAKRINLKTQSKKNHSSLPMNTESNTVSTDSNLNEEFITETQNIQDKQLGTSNQVKSETLNTSLENEIVNSDFENLEFNETSTNYLSGLSILEIPNNSESQQIISSNATEQIVSSTQSVESGSRWFVGQTSEVNNNWLFNHDLKNAARQESKNSILPHMSMTHAFVLSKEIQPGKYIRAEFIVAKREGQNILTYSEGIVQRKTLDLNYSGLTILADQKTLYTRTIFGFPVKSHWIGGVSMCVLSGSKLAIGQSENTPIGYRKMNVSLLAGYEKEVMLSNRISFASGFRLSGGLTNIFKGYDNIPSWFNRTHSGNIAWTFSLRYSFNTRSY